MTNVNSRPENHGDEPVYATDLTMEVAVPKEVLKKLFPTEKPFLDQFYAGDDVVLGVICPLEYGKQLKDITATVGFDEDELVFTGAKVAKGMKLKPLAGGSVELKLTLQVYPGSEENSGRLDWLAKRWIDVTIDTPQTDIEDATGAKTES